MPKAQTTDDLFNPARPRPRRPAAAFGGLVEAQGELPDQHYYPADFVWNGQTVRNVGIRSRGRGSRNANKPGLKVDFDRYVDKQEFLGLKSLVLDNLTQDPSGIHETVSMRFFERLGIPAPRETHVKLYVNNEYIGLYGLIESVDKKFLARAFGVIGDDTQNDGWLYEFVWQDHWRFTDLGTDLASIKLRFDATTHESKTDEEKYRRDPGADHAGQPDARRSLRRGDRPAFRLPGFIRFVAAQAYLGDTDGFLGAFGINNFYLYRLENQDKHVLIAWDTDNTFWGPTFPIKPPTTNVLMQKLMRIPEYNALWYAELARANELAEQDGWLDAEIIRQVQMIDEAMKSRRLQAVFEQQLRGRGRRDAVFRARPHRVREVRAAQRRSRVRRDKKAHHGGHEARFTTAHDVTVAQNTKGRDFSRPFRLVSLLATLARASERSRLGAAARRAAVAALVAGAAADHDRPAGGARRRVFLVLHRRERRRLRHDRAGRAHRGGRRRPPTFGAGIAGAVCRLRRGLVAVVDAGAELRLRRQELRRHPAEDVVDDRLGEPHVGVLGHARRLEARVAELVDQRLQRHAVLQRVADRLGERVGKARDRRAFLGHHQEDLARHAVLEQADRDVALVAGDVELVRDRLALVGQLAARRRARRPAPRPPRP